MPHPPNKNPLSLYDTLQQQAGRPSTRGTASLGPRVGQNMSPRLHSLEVRRTAMVPPGAGAVLFAAGRAGRRFDKRPSDPAVYFVEDRRWFGVFRHPGGVVGGNMSPRLQTPGRCRPGQSPDCDRATRRMTSFAEECCATISPRVQSRDLLFRRISSTETSPRVQHSWKGCRRPTMSAVRDRRA